MDAMISAHADYYTYSSPFELYGFIGYYLVFHYHHAPDFLGACGTQAQLDALKAFVAAGHRGTPSDAALDEGECLVIEYATQMTLDVKVSDALFAAMRGHFDGTEMVKLTTAIAAYNMVSRILVALQIEPEA